MVLALTSEELSLLNPGIRRTVQWVRARGYDTCDSGDGETREFPCDRDYPYVVIPVSVSYLVEEADRLWSDLRWLYHPGEVPAEILLQANYGPQDGLAFLDLSGLSDRLLPPE